MRRFSILVALLLLAAPLPAQVPDRVTYQGVLTRPDGQPIPDGTYSVRVEIYATEQGGTPLATRTATAQFTRGAFAVTLDTLALHAVSNPTLWLSIAVDLDGNGFSADEVYSPRQQLTAAPYALQAGNARNAAQLGLLPASAYFNDGDSQIYTRASDGFLTGRFGNSEPSTPYGAFYLYGASAIARIRLFAGPDVGSILLVGDNGSFNAEISSLAANHNHGAISVNDAQGIIRGQLAVDQNGFGVSWAEIKNFVTDHPSHPDAKIIYVSLEGPEAAIYCRGKVQLEDGRATIPLPEHFAALARPDSLTVQLTPGAAKSLGVAVAELAADHVAIQELHGGTGSYPVHYTIHATRNDVPENQPVISRAEFERTFGTTRAKRDNVETPE